MSPIFKYNDNLKGRYTSNNLLALDVYLNEKKTVS